MIPGPSPIAGNVSSRKTRVVPIVVPTLGPSSAPMTLCNWLIDRGESVECGESLLEISLPGIVYDLPAPASGILLRIERSISDRLVPGNICGWILRDDEPTACDETPGHQI